MKSRAKYYFERVYPYLIAFTVTYFSRKTVKVVIDNSKYTEVLNGLVTLDSIVIGFLGAIMPVILSMKNESKLVRYVFENDINALFSKYLKVTVFSGLLSAVFSLLMHLSGSMKEQIIWPSYCMWIFFTSLFLVSTYRSMSHMITLVFSKDNLDEKDVEYEREKSTAERNLEEKYK